MSEDQRATGVPEAIPVDLLLGLGVDWDRIAEMSNEERIASVQEALSDGRLGLVSRMVEPLTATTNRWTEHTYNANNDVNQTIVSQDGSGSLRTVTRFCYDTGCTLTGTGLTQLSHIENYVSGGPSNNETNVRTDFLHDAYGQRTSVTRHNRDAAGAVLDDREDRYAFDANGNLTAEIVNFASGTVTGGDDVTPNATTQARTDLTTAHTYDTAGNRISSADPRRAILAVTGSPGADDYVTRRTFDALNRQVGEEAPTTPGSSAQDDSSTGYDELGNVRTGADTGDLVTASEFDRSGRATRTFEDPAGSDPASVTAVATYDAEGRPTVAVDRRQVADPSLGQTETAYDGLGRAVLATAAAGTADESVTETGYDALDRRTSYVVGGQESTYAYDIGGRVTATDDGFTCTTEAFDYRDLATSTTHGKDGNGCVGSGQYTVTHIHDPLGRLVRDEQGSLRPLDDTLDAVGNRLRSAPVTDGFGGPVTSTSDFDVNLLDQVVSETRTESGSSRTSKTTFDAAGNPVDSCRWEGGATVGDCPTGNNPPAHVSTTTYDALNQRLSLTDGATNQTTVYDPNENYQPAAVYTPIASGIELQSLYGYDSQHRLVSLVTQQCTISTGHGCASTVPLGSSAYALDPNHNRTQVTESHDGSTPVERFYCYDPRDQLVARSTGADCEAGSDESYAYDAAGNRLTATDASGTRSFSYSAEGQIAGVMHDAAGRIIDLPEWHMIEYDPEGRLSSLCDSACSSGSLRLFFRYDADGRRTSITEAGGGQSTTTELRYVDGRISAEYTHTCDIDTCTDPQLSRSYVTDESGAVVKMVIPSGAEAGTYLVTWNGHGDALNLLHLDGGGVTLANSFTYDTWGGSTVHLHNGFGDLSFRFRYVGQHGVQDDAVHGLPMLLMGARHYSPELGRFLQPDPAAISENLFSYASANPVSDVDPSGSASCRELTAIIGYLTGALTKRYEDLRQNRLGLNWSGRNSIQGHRQQFQQDQARSRDALYRFGAAGCGFKGFRHPANAWRMATIGAPYPSGRGLSSHRGRALRVTPARGWGGAVIRIGGSARFR